MSILPVSETSTSTGIDAGQVDIDVDFRRGLEQIDGRGPRPVGPAESDNVEGPIALMHGGVEPPLEFAAQPFNRLGQRSGILHVGHRLLLWLE